MFQPLFTQFLFPALLMLIPAQVALAACTADSGDRRQHLLELYTSEGCSSCPPADAYLSGLKQEKGVWPLAFHVDYWNHLGWPDRFSKPEFSQRQRAGAGRNGSRFVYTPQFVLDGRDWRPGGGKAPWQRGGREPAGRLTLRIDPHAAGTLAVSGTWTGEPGLVYLAVHENNLESAVRAGENTGRRLRHDFVVRELVGPLALKDGKFSQRLDLLRAWKSANLGVTAFVTHSANTTVLQAVGIRACSP